MRYLSLYELGDQVKKALDAQLEPVYWVVGEIGEIRLNRNGHCYLDLVEKEEDELKAKFRVTIWSYTYRRLIGWFEAITGHSLQPGMKILAQVEVSFHEAYGLSLNIKDIDPNFTLGERARRRQEILRQLTDEGVLEMNKSLELPLVPQRIAIISSATAAGFGDFMDHLENNSFQYVFYTRLFQASMQGKDAERSIIEAMYQVNDALDAGAEFDVLAIIRGGGAQVDLDCFDTYNVATHIAQFPIPVITGIGHERDETIADGVAHTRMKTPTAVADFLMNGIRSFEELIDLQYERMDRLVNERLQTERFNLQSIQQKLEYLGAQIVFRAVNRINQLGERMQYGVKIQFKSGRERLFQLEESVRKLPVKVIEKHLLRLNYLQKHLELLNPEQILKRGYSVTLLNKKTLQAGQQINVGDQLITRTYHKTITSKVTDTKDRDA